MRLSLIAILLCSSLAVRVQAQCTLEGVGVVEAVTPDGTSLSVGVSEQVRVAMTGNRARVEGVTPIAFEGRVAVSMGPDGTRTESRDPTVWLDALAGLVTPPCTGLSVHVPLAAVLAARD